MRNDSRFLPLLRRALLPGSAYTGGSSRLVCTARTAGSRTSPLAMIGEPTPLLSLSPASGPIPRNHSFTATFGRAVSGFGPDNFIVRGLQSGERNLQHCLVLFLRGLAHAPDRRGLERRWEARHRVQRRDLQR
jgi:hypothetical protein